MKKQFDLIVIGGGSGGIAHARRAAEYGANVAVVEYGPLGGTCVNVGCVPKKVMWYTASQMHHFEHATDYGFDVEVNFDPRLMTDIEDRGRYWEGVCSRYGGPQGDFNVTLTQPGGTLTDG